MKKTRFYIDNKAVGAWISVMFMLCAAIIRIVYFWGRKLTSIEIWIHLINVVCAALIFAVTVIFFGKKLPQLTALSVLMGVVFFIVKAFTFESRLHTFLCIILYLLVLTLYTSVIFGLIGLKKLLYPLFGLPLLYHIFVEDMQIYILSAPRPPFLEWLPEISVLCIMASLLSVSFAIKEK